MYHTFNFTSHQDEYTFDDQYVFLSNGGCRLRSHDQDMNYVPSGIFEESTIELPNMEGTAVREFTGLFIEAIIPDGTALGYQVSIDDGTTWQWYDGSTWQVAGAADWSTITQIDAGIGTLGGRQLKVKIRLTPDSLEVYTPHIYRIHVFYEAVWSYFEDLKRSIKRFIDTTSVNHLVWAQAMGSAGSSVILDNSWQILGVGAVYNVTADPGRLTNIFSAYDSGTRTVTLTGAAAAGDVIEVHYTGRCNVFLAADEDLQISEVPSIVVVLPRAREDKYAPKNLFEYEPLRGKGVVRRRERSIPTLSTMMIYAVASTDVEALAIQDSLAEIFEPEPTFKSVAVGEDFFCLTYEPLIDNDMVSTGLHVKTTQLLVLGNKELRAYSDLQPITVIGEEYVGAAQVGEPGDPISVESLVSGTTWLNPICSTLPSEKGDIDE